MTPAQSYSPKHQEILDAAMHLIAERGVSGASLRALARRVNISQPSLYHYFDSKQQLVDQVLDSYTHEVALGTMAMIQQQLPVPSDPAGLLRLALQRVIEVWSGPRQPIFVRFLFQVTMACPELGPRVRELFLDRAFRMAQAAIGPLIASGQVRADDAEARRRVAIGALVMHFMQERVLNMNTPDAPTPAHLADFIVDIVVNGAVSRAASGRAQGERSQ